MEIEDQVLVGRLHGNEMSSEELKNWTKINFEP